MAYRADKLSGKQQLQPVTSQQFQDVELWRSLQVRKQRDTPWRLTSRDWPGHSKPGKLSKICQPFPWKEANMIKQPPAGDERLPWGQLPEETCKWDISSHPQQHCSARYMAWPQHASFLSCLSHHTRRLLNSCYHTGMLGWPRHASAAAAAVTHTAFRWPCSPGTICAKDIRKLAQGEGGSQAEGRAAWGREQFLLLRHSTSVSHVAGSYETV